MLIQNCASGDLSIYVPDNSNPWSEEQVRHLYSRLSYGPTKPEVDAAMGMSPSALIDQLLDNASGRGAPAAPYWGSYTTVDYNGDTDLIRDHRNELRRTWIKTLTEIDVSKSIQSKMALFWHNHFVTEYNDYDCNSYAWNYYSLLHEKAFGNFKDFVMTMGTSPAMLIYLDGYRNTKNKANENYARELMELFTMGEGNGYTQVDVAQVAKALTGYKVDKAECTPPTFDASDFNDDAKTIFGQTGNWGFAEVHDLIFTLRAEEVSKFICTKLYKHFIYNTVDEALVDELALEFRTNNFELLPIIKKILKSNRFFDPETRATGIKSHIDNFIYAMRPIGLIPETDLNNGDVYFIYSNAARIGMQLLEPPNVAGWPGHREWLNENTLAYRWSYASNLLYSRINNTGKNRLRDLALVLASQSNDPYIIAEEVAKHFLRIPLDPQLLEVAVLSLKSDIPQNYFDDGTWNLTWDEAPDQLINLLNYLTRLPEYQIY